VGEKAGAAFRESGNQNQTLQEFSSVGRASVSKTEGRGFESLNSCQISQKPVLKSCKKQLIIALESAEESDMDRFKGRLAVITGGADGIGKALGKAFADAGMKVALLDIREDAARETATELSANGADVRGYACDVTLSESIEAAAAAVKADFGSVALLCANAGVGAAGGPIAAKPATADWVLSVNQKGVLDTLRAFRPLMDDGSGPRHVLVTASSASLVSPAASRLALYGGSKHCTMGMAEAAAAELAEEGIATTILCPGLINTRIWDGARARSEHFGGPRYQPEETGENWRQNGMDVNWVAACTLEAITAGDRYCAPVDAHSVDDFEARVAAIRKGFRCWQDRDMQLWPGQTAA
jgi:NAD(P)-dependent dehydrogenase (short-subunit alcohol dehydrogenase family)